MNTTICEHANPFIASYYCQWNGLIVFYAIALLLLFIALATAAQLYFAPNLSTISTKLNLSETVSGVTLAALGNGAPDLFTTYTAIKSNSPALALGELFGAAAFISMFVVGCIAIISPFQLPRRPFIRDVIFFAITLLCLMHILKDGQITLFESVGLVCFYISYVLIVVVSHVIYQRMKRHQLLLSSIHIESDRESDSFLDIEDSCESDQLIRPLLGGIPNTLLIPHDDQYRSPLLSSRLEYHEASSTLTRFYGSPMIPSPSSLSPTIVSIRSQYTGLLYQFFPILARWKAATITKKFQHICMAPLILAFELTIPVATDDEANRSYEDDYLLNEGASKISDTEQRILLCIQSFVSPWLLLLSSSSIPAIAPLFIGSFASFGVWFASRNHLHQLAIHTAFCGFGVSMLWIYCIANLIVLLLQAFGEILGMDEAILGLTIFAVANSLGDFMTNISICKMGYPAMAIGACFGSPMLNLLLGIGVSCTIAILQTDQPYPIHVHVTVFVSGIGIVVGLLFSLFAISLNGFKAGRIYGCILVLGYTVCIGVSLISSAE